MPTERDFPPYKDDGPITRQTRATILQSKMSISEGKKLMAQARYQDHKNQMEEKDVIAKTAD